MTQTTEQLTARVRELEEENARLKAESRDACFGLNDYYGSKLAAAQAERDAVNTIAKRQSAILTRTGDELADCRVEIAALKAERDTRIAQLERQRDELLAATEAIAINSEECLDFDECTAMLVSIDDYHKLMEAVARAKGEQ